MRRQVGQLLCDDVHQPGKRFLQATQGDDGTFGAQPLQPLLQHPSACRVQRLDVRAIDKRLRAIRQPHRVKLVADGPQAARAPAPRQRKLLRRGLRDRSGCWRCRLHD